MCTLRCHLHLSRPCKFPSTKIFHSATFSDTFLFDAKVRTCTMCKLFLNAEQWTLSLLDTCSWVAFSPLCRRHADNYVGFPLRLHHQSSKVGFLRVLSRWVCGRAPIGFNLIQLRQRSFGSHWVVGSSRFHRCLFAWGQPLLPRPPLFAILATRSGIALSRSPLPARGSVYRRLSHHRRHCRLSNDIWRSTGLRPVLMALLTFLFLFVSFSVYRTCRLFCVLAYVSLQFLD